MISIRPVQDGWMQRVNLTHTLSRRTTHHTESVRFAAPQCPSPKTAETLALPRGRLGPAKLDTWRSRLTAKDTVLQWITRWTIHAVSICRLYQTCCHPHTTCNVTNWQNIVQHQKCLIINLLYTQTCFLNFKETFHHLWSIMLLAPNVTPYGQAIIELLSL